MDRRAQLQGWIEDTRRLQRRLAIACALLGVIAVAVRWYSPRVGGTSLLIVALIMACSSWVTAAHNAAHRQKLDELARARADAITRA
jgi:hypothetical protein